MLFNNEMYRCMLLKSAIMKNDDFLTTERSCHSRECK